MTSPAQPAVPPLLQLEGWGMSRGRRTVLADIDLCLDGPGIVVLMGPAGTGKSSLLKAISGQHNAHGERWGQLLYQGTPLDASSQPPALVHQQPRDLGFTVQENLAAALRQHRGGSFSIQRQDIITRLQALDANALIDHLQHKLIDLPRGLARQLAIVRAAFSGSPLLLIDEPTSELDTVEAEHVLALIQRLAQEHACLVTLHHQGQARRIASRIVLLAGGRVQVDTDTDAFFANTTQHPVLAQFLRTGSCHVASPDAHPEELADNVPAPPVVEKITVIAPLATMAPPAAPAPSLAPVPSVTLPATPSRRGPNGFHWLVPGKLAGCPMPGVVFAADHDLALLRGMGVTVLVNLTETPMAEAPLARHGLRSYHMGIVDRRAPPLLWAKLLLAKIELMLREGEVVAVHCLAGLGRTGMVLAAWLVREGLTADEALRRLRTIEPGFVQSREQEDLLHALEENLLIRAC